MRFPATAVLMLILLPGYAQDAPPEPFKPVFPRLFPKPTGLNGFEEIVQAGDICKLHPGLNKILEEGATLTEKRRVLREPSLVSARELLRAGLAKPVSSPLSKGETDVAVESFSGIRLLARLLLLEQYVLLADGKVGEAISSLRDGLRLGYVAQSQMVLGGLVGSAVNALSIHGIAEHLDQLSARDCEGLLKLANDWLSAPDPCVAALDAERKYALKEVHAELGGNSKITPEIHALVSARIQQYQALMKVEPWKRTPLSPIEGTSRAAEIVRGMGLDEAYGKALNAFALDLARVQMLGVHAAIRRFRWEHNRLPSSLAEVKVGRLATDPLSGQPFSYQPADDSRYTLRGLKVDRL